MGSCLKGIGWISKTVWKTANTHHISTLLRLLLLYYGILLLRLYHHYPALPLSSTWSLTDSSSAGVCRTLSVLLLPLQALLQLVEVLGGSTALWLLVVTALVKYLGQVGSVDLPQLLIVTQSSAQVPVFTFTNTWIHIYTHRNIKALADKIERLKRTRTMNTSA